jgi:hypothetical protein
MDPVLVQAMQEMGVTPAHVDALRRIPFEMAVKRLGELKQTAKDSYRKLAFKYHPDRNPGDAKAEALFKAIGIVLKEIEGLVVERPRPQPIMVIQHIPRAHPFGGTVTIRGFATNTGSGTSTTYDARRVAFIRFV